MLHRKCQLFESIVAFQKCNVLNLKAEGFYFNKDYKAISVQTLTDPVLSFQDSHCNNKDHLSILDP